MRFNPSNPQAREASEPTPPTGVDSQGMLRAQDLCRLRPHLSLPETQGQKHIPG